jgi:hypothetical protein
LFIGVCIVLTLAFYFAKNIELKHPFHNHRLAQHQPLNCSEKLAWSNMITRQTFIHVTGNPNQIWVIGRSHKK